MTAAQAACVADADLAHPYWCDTAAVITAAHNEVGMSFRDIETAGYNDRCNARISQATAQRMAGPEE
jgi:hypothetical protein